MLVQVVYLIVKIFDDNKKSMFTLYFYFLTCNAGKRCFSRVGFIGLGNMGGHMARNILRNVNYSLFRLRIFMQIRNFVKNKRNKA